MSFLLLPWDPKMIAPIQVTERIGSTQKLIPGPVNTSYVPLFEHEVHGHSWSFVGRRSLLSKNLCHYRYQTGLVTQYAKGMTSIFKDPVS